MSNPGRLLRRFVDWDLTRPGMPRNGSLSAAVGLLLLAFATAVTHGESEAVSFISLLPALPLPLAWSGFVVWRQLRLLRAAALKGERSYDRGGKAMLSADYADSESATAARLRRERAKRS